MSLRSSSVLSQLLIVMVGVAVMTGSQLARAQTFRGGIHGTVDDSSGAFLARAEVKAANEGTGQVYRTVTTSAGEFTFQDLPLGSYTVSVRQNGFQPLEVSQVTVRAGSIYSLPLKLALASVATKVEVAAAALYLAADESAMVTGSALMQSVQAALLESDRLNSRSEVAQNAAARIASLTERERGVMALAVEGLPNKEIARRLGISHRTVEIHKARIMQKTGADTLLDLARVADAGGLGR